MGPYEEKQQFNGIWVFMMIALFTLPTLLITDREEFPIVLLVVGGTLLLTGLLLFFLKQTIRIDKEGVHFKQTPIHRTYRTIKWADIQSWKVNKISALSDFGGWGYRLTSKKTGYIIAGDYGLELKTDAKRLTVLSIKNKEEVEQAMEKYGQYV